MDIHIPPHAPYIDAVLAELTTAQLLPEGAQAFEDELDGHPLLRGRIFLTPETSRIPADRWPHGLLIVWEWHTGQNPDITRGPSWHWASATEQGWAKHGWQDLPVPGWAMPATLAATTATLAHTGTPTRMSSQWHTHKRAPVQAAIDAWAAHN